LQLSREFCFWPIASFVVVQHVQQKLNTSAVLRSKLEITRVAGTVSRNSWRGSLPDAAGIDEAAGGDVEVASRAGWAASLRSPPAMVRVDD
jgi:hypothetical protein